MMRRLLLSLSITSCLAACSSIDCPVQNKVSVNYSVCQYDNGKEVADTLTDTLYIWTRRKDGTDTLLLNRGVNTRSFTLPVSYSHPEDVLIFATTNTNNDMTLDTVWINKEDIPHFESVDCGARYFHNLTAVRSTHSAIDTIIINNPSVTYDETADHLHIHFKTSR